ncbi:aspartate aminotransferase family protein [Pararhodobacter aggregans]|uniref:Aspartate aminotransferase family protein n=1 Tax=Pararhodobacter aggregans TaxID=404875 RepID=A0A2T7USH4_9RHOB|nr:aspartate aminotransferase family protein [Pararhodobacter aggregans]PTX03402.1 adenosylmethionine-8-amino-7-oxononanoate aminotransferase [Pararhodobacter aggregans]PVE47695.1 aspartate aminotransferase family protein [Pararhodobacter aggregans]
MTATESPFSERGGPIQVFYAPLDATRRPMISHAEGIYMWDTAGKRYLDATSGPVVSNIGHGNKAVLAAMAEQAGKVCYASRALFENEANIALAERVAGLAGPGFERVFVVSGGSEATEAAIKLARQYAVAKGEAGRWKVLARNPGYHGATLGAAAVTGDPETDAVFEPVMRIMPRVPAPFTYRTPGNIDADTHARDCAQALETAILEEGPDSVLAFIMEPVGGLATGALVAPDHYYTAVREICTRHGVLLIFDEVMSGAGRTGRFLAAEHWPDARPDMVTLAKGVAAGYTPLGMVLASRGMVQTVVDAGGFMHGHTYSANPLSCAIGDAVLREVMENDLIGNAARMGALLGERLQALAAQSGIVGDVRGLGLLRAIEIVADKTTKTPFPPSRKTIARIVQIGLEKGLLLYSRSTAGGRYGEWLMMTPPLTLTEPQLDEMMALLTEVLSTFEAEARG